MRVISLILTLILPLFLAACAPKGSNPVDPYERINRKIHAFNMVVDNAIFRPPALFYVTLVPSPVRRSVNNFFNNVNMVPTIANDILQLDRHYFLKDTWRFFINTTFGIGGLFDPASHFGFAPHSNDLGLTFAKWGDTQSPYVVLPFAGPSTIRDTVGVGIEYAVFSPYAWIFGGVNTYAVGVMGLRYVDVRSNYFDTEKLLREALDDYTFMRDAWLQNRQYHITGVEVIQTAEPAADSTDAPAVVAGVGGDYVDE